MADFLIDSLQDSGYNPITLSPEWSFSENEIARRATNRSQGGVQRVWDWGTHKGFTVPITWVSSADKFRINNWWRDSEVLAFTLSSSLDDNTSLCRIANGQQPLGLLHRPYTDFFRGTLQLEAIDASSYQAQPFVLDDAVMGLLDQSYNALA